MIQENEETQVPALLWVDHLVFSQENQFYYNQFEKDYQDSFFTINDEFEYFEVVQKNQDKKLIILSSEECAYNLVQITRSPIIVFCKNKHYHYDLFQSNTQIKAIVSSSFQDANLCSITCMNHFENLKSLQQLVTPIQVAPSPQYQHSKYNISIQFFVVIEEIRKSQKITDAQLYDEIHKLLLPVCQIAMVRVGNAKYNVEQQEIKRGKKMNTFEKFLFLYSLEDLQFYKVLNTAFAQYNYQQIKGILVLLMQGFRKASKKQSFQNLKTLYRGISLKQNIFDSITKDLMESKENQTSLFWNQLISASTDYNKALNFAFNDNFGILFQFELDSVNPHPHIQMPIDLTKFDENEVLLFPQFEFVVQNIEKLAINKNILIVTLKQQKNGFAFVLDRKLRNLYWQDVQNKLISPKVKSLVEFFFQRTEQLIEYIVERETTIYMMKFRLKEEIMSSFNEILSELLKIFSHNTNELRMNVNTMISLFKTEITFENQSNNLIDYIENFKVYFKSIKKALRSNICSLLLKGMIDAEFCLEFLKSLGQKFQASQQHIKLSTLDYKGQQIKFTTFENGNIQNTTALTYQQIRAQKITSIQKVQHKNGTQAYEVTLKDGNRLLMHHNPNNNDILMISKQIDAQGKVGYTNKWKQMGEPQKIKHLTVEDVQSSIKGKDLKFDLANVNSIEMSAQMQQARATGQLGGAIATAAGSLAVDLLLDDFDGKNIGKAVAISAGVQGGLMYLQTVKSMAKTVPFVGIGLAATMTTISIGQVFLSDFLKTSEKYYSALLVTIKTATSIGLGIAGVEGGMLVGAAGGPFGVIIGGIIGGLLGGAGGNLLNRGLDVFTQFSIDFDFEKENKSLIKDGFLVSAGKLPTIKWKNVKKKVKSMVLIAQSDKHMACIIPNIDPEKQEISHKDNMGLKLKGYRYIGPDDQCKEISFRLFAMMDEYVDENEILLCLKKNSLKLIDIAEKKIKF